MPSRKTPSTRAVGALSAVALVLMVAALLTTGSPLARAATTGQIKQRIDAGQGSLSTLAGAVSSASGQVKKLGVNVSRLAGQISRLQTGLDARRAELLKLRGELNTEGGRLEQLEASEARAEGVLSQQLVGSYEADRPDIVSVVLESTGFSNLLERFAFAQQVGDHDAQIAARVRGGRRAVAAQATRLGVLSARQQWLTGEVLYERNRVARARVALVSQQIAATRMRDAKAGQLSAARGQASALRAQLAKLEETQGAQPGLSAPSGSGSAGFTFPMPKGDVSPPATWSLDDGVDISAPGGTPELAVCSGTVVLHGIGGFGPSAPVLHCDSPLAGYDYVYYGHAGPGHWVPVGTHVSQGQVISQVGYGIVGISTGPHLEIGFADSSGSPIGSSSAPRMLSLLRAAYGG